MGAGSTVAKRPERARIARVLVAWLASLLVLIVGCGDRGRVDPGCGPRPADEGPWLPEDGSACERLSTYGLVSLDSEGRVVPAADTLPFDLSTPLFSDYALKTRTVWVPEGSIARMDERGAIDFPVGTVITKTFAFPADFREPDRARDVVETRLLVRLADGWDARPYVWNEAQTEARLRPVGERVPVTWIDRAGETRSTDYQVPNANQCIECHGNVRPGTGRKELGVIGPRAKHLNRDFDYGQSPDGGGVQNQLDRWREDGLLEGGPTDPADAPRLPAWDDPDSGTLHERARAYLDVNCGHCHNFYGSASYTGLFLQSEESDPLQWGVCQSRSSEDAPIVPGHPDRSWIVQRTSTTDLGVRMPRLGRTVVHREGVALLRDWITWLGTAEAVERLGLDDPRYDCF